MEIHDNFTKWAIEQGVKINGVAAHRFPGKGIGIVAQKRLEAREIVITVPVRALRTIRTVPRNISKSIGKITVHGLLAADLTADTSSTRAAWRAVLPTKTDFEESMPLMWPEQLQTLLPAIAKNLLLNQKRKFNDDWSAVSLAFPETSKENYLYNWLIVNTRTFYYLPSTTKKPPPRDDCMALNPFADYFNHVHDGGLEVEFSDKGYTISTNVAIEKGEELNISYGNHGNSFLLAEYGFILKENKWDEVSLDGHILPRLSTKQRDLLREVNFFGNYVLDKENVCHRTQVALRLLCLPLRTWRQYVEGLQDGQKEQVTVDLVLLEVLESHKQEALLTLERISTAKDGHDCQRRTLSTHWKQILQLLEAAIARIKKIEI